MFNCDVTLCPLKKQTAAVMSLEVMKWQNYFCDDIMSDANLQDRTFTCIYIFLACQSNLTSAHVTVKNITNVPYNNINLLYIVYSMSEFLLILLTYHTF